MLKTDRWIQAVSTPGGDLRSLDRNFPDLSFPRPLPALRGPASSTRVDWFSYSF